MTTKKPAKSPGVAPKKEKKMSNKTTTESIVGDVIGRVEKVVEEAKRVEAKGVEQFCATMDEIVKLQKTQLDYLVKLSDEWRSLVKDSGTRFAALLKTKAA